MSAARRSSGSSRRTASSSSRPSPSAWASTSRTCASSPISTCRNRSRPTTRRPAARAATARPANAWMAYGLQDIVTQRQWLAQSEAGEAHKAVQRGKLDALIGLAEMVGCRRQALLAYFGETLDTSPAATATTASRRRPRSTAPPLAQKALSAVYRTGQRFGVGYVVDVLIAKADERIQRNGHDRLSVFGIGRDMAAAEWRGAVPPAGRRRASRHRTTRATARWRSTESARPLLRGEQNFRCASRLQPETTRRTKAGRKAQPVPAKVGQADEALFQALRALRPEARRRGQRAALRHLPRPHARLSCREAAGRASGAARHHRPRRAQDRTLWRGVARGDRAVQATSDAGTTACRRPSTRRWRCICEGRDAEAIADERGIEVSTVLGHFAEAIEAGLIEARAVLRPRRGRDRRDPGRVRAPRHRR